MTILTVYIDSKQSINIVSDNHVEVSGGRMEFEYTFNYTKVESGKTTIGWGQGKCHIM